MRKSYSIFDDMISSGNLVAEFREGELRQLERLLSLLKPEITTEQAAVTTLASLAAAPTINVDTALSGETFTGNDGTLNGMDAESSVSGGLNPLGDKLFDTRITSEQILDIAGSINDQDMAWMCDTIMEHNDW